MRNGNIAAAVSVLLLAGCANQPVKVVEAPKTKLYEMFQKYCVATGGQFDAVDKAVTADGFVHHQGPGVMAQILQIGVGSVTWQKGKDVVTIGPGHRYKIGADGSAQPWPYDPPETKVDSCFVSIQVERDDSQVPIAKWAGVPVVIRGVDTKAFGDQLNDMYAFRVENGKHITSSLSEEPRAIKSGGYWSVHFYERDNEYGVGVSHYYLPEGANKP